MTTIVRHRVRALAWIAARTVLPAVLLLVLAVVLGVVRTTLLGAFGLVVALKVVMTALQVAAEYAPTPAYRLEVNG